jgi:HAD superfamily hydrolase (TIGR01459 family)
MTKNLDSTGLKSIADQYDLFFIDLWGVVHNGVELYQESIDVLEKLLDIKKELVLLTNAPRPNCNVVDFLKRMGLEQKFYSTVYTSGEAALNYLTSNFKNKTFFHLGPPRDFGLFKNFNKNKTQKIIEAEYLLCTGLFDEHDKELSYYKTLLKKEIGKIMICTNPDLIVDRGQKREFCAGSVAKVFEELGGKVEYFGKPYPKVYNQAAKIKNKKVFCIGDNLNTDIKGANNQNFASLLITNGIHRQEIKNESFEKIIKKYNARVDYTQSELKW